MRIKQEAAWECKQSYPCPSGEERAWVWAQWKEDLFPPVKEKAGSSSEVCALRVEDRNKQMVTSRKRKRAEISGRRSFLLVPRTWPAERCYTVSMGPGCSNGIMVEEMVARRADFCGDSEILGFCSDQKCGQTALIQGRVKQSHKRCWWEPVSMDVSQGTECLGAQGSNNHTRAVGIPHVMVGHLSCMRVPTKEAFSLPFLFKCMSRMMKPNGGWRGYGAII